MSGSGYVATLSLMLLGATAFAGVDVKGPGSLAVGPHLFIDDYLIASQSGFERRLEHPMRMPGPVVTGPEDKNFQPYVSVVHDPQTKRFRMWYGVPAADQKSSPSHLAYIESADGIHWDRPHRVLSDPGGMPVRFGASVIDDGAEFPDPSRRYKFAWNFGDFSTPSGMIVATSPDGYAWAPVSSKPPVLVHTHDINNIYHDPIRKNYLATVNMLVPEPGWTQAQGAKGKRRRTFQSTSIDLVNWTKPHEVIPPDAHDQGDFQYYAMSGYLARGPLLIGLIKVLRDDLPAEPGGEVRGIGYTALAWTRDGVHWERDREPFLDRNPNSDTWDRAMTWADCQLLVGSETFLYYGGYKRGHKVERFTERQIGLARMPRDRYVARVAKAEGGLLTTRLAILDSKSVSVNADVKGELRARLLDAQGRPLPGFDFPDCEPIRGDYLHVPIRWKRSIGDVNQQPVSLQFQMRDGALYAFELHAQEHVNAEAAGAPLPNSLFMAVEGPTRIGYFFSAQVWPVDTRLASHSDGPVFVPDGTHHAFTFKYDPSSNQGQGTITFTLDGKEWKHNLTKEQRQSGATFDKFGLVNIRRGGKYVEVYFDDLSYTARPDKNAKPEFHTDKITRVPYPPGGRQY